MVFLVRVNSADIDLTSVQHSEEITELRWFSTREVVELTEAFQDSVALWGGGWTEMLLRTFIEGGEEKFNSMYCFEYDPPGRWIDPYKEIKNKEKGGRVGV